MKNALRTIILGALVLLEAITPNYAYALDPPTISPTGSYTIPKTVTMSAGTGISIYYTTDGSIPTTASTQYVSPITVSVPTELNAVAYSGKIYSSVTTAYLDIDPNLALVLSSPAGTGARTIPKVWLKSDMGIHTSVSNPEKVVFWADLSGNGNHATAIGATAPRLAPESVNGFPAISFDGSQSLNLPSNTYVFSGVTIFLVTQPKSIVAGSRLLDIASSASGNNIVVQIAASDSKAELGIFNSGGGSSFVQSISDAVKVNDFKLFSARSYLPGSSTGTFYVNGVPGTPNTSMPEIAFVTRDSNSVGQGNGFFFQGKLAELLIYDKGLDDHELRLVHSYLLNKYQLLSPVPGQPAKPSFSIPAGVLLQPTQLVLRSEPGTVIRYTTNGDDPTANSRAWDGCPLTINFTQTIKAIAIKNDFASPIESKTYTLDSTLWPAPSSGDTTAPSLNGPLQLPRASN